VVLALGVLCLCGLALARDARPTRRLRLAARARSPFSRSRAWRSPRRRTASGARRSNAFTPYVIERRACLSDLTCIARNGDRLNALESPGFRLGPYLDQRVSVFPGTRP